MKAKNNPAFKYLNFATSFGITLVLMIYLLYQGGEWLDERLGTEPLFIIIGIFLAIGAVFKRLFTEIKFLDKEDKPHNNNPGNPGEE